MVEAEVKCSLTHQGIPIIFWKQIEGAFSRACEMFFSSKHFDLLARQGYCSSNWCVQQRLATGCVGLAVFISNRALSLNYSYNYSIYKEATENMLNKRHSLHTVRQLIKPHLT